MEGEFSAQTPGFVGLPGYVFTKPLSLSLFLCLWFYGPGFLALAQGWVWSVSPPALWPSCLFLASVWACWKARMTWGDVRQTLEGCCDSSLYLTGLGHVRSMTVVVFVWNLIRDFESAIWRLCSFCSFLLFLTKTGVEGQKMGFAILLTSAHRVEGLSFLNFIFFFLEARGRYEAAVFGGFSFVFFLMCNYVCML